MDFEHSGQFGDRKGIGDVTVLNRTHHKQGQARQSDDAAGEGVEEELDRGLASLRSTPNSDQKEQREQRELEKDVKQHQVEGAKRAVQAPHQDEQAGIILALAIMNRRPGNQHGRTRQQRGQEDQRQADSVHPEMELEMDLRVVSNLGDRVASP